MGWGVILSGASILALSFLGFDAVTTVVEEAKNPEKNIGKAILITCLGAGLAFTIISYLMQLSWPMGWNEFENADTGSYELIVKVCGTAMSYFFTASYCVGALASAMASQASASRILFGMGRDNILPKKIFAYVHPKFKTPTYNIILIGLISLVALKLSLAAAASLINFGALLGFTLVNLSVIAYYFIRKKNRSASGVFLYLILPLAGAATTFTIWFSIVFAVHSSKPLDRIENSTHDPLRSDHTHPESADALSRVPVFAWTCTSVSRSSSVPCPPDGRVERRSGPHGCWSVSHRSCTIPSAVARFE
jgi:putrescine importer